MPIARTTRGPIEYRLEGEGPTVLVLNGGHCSRATRLSHERLAEHGFSVLTPSRPGYDHTPSSVGRSAQDAVDAIAALLDVLRIPAVFVIGISAAGPTALALAARHPSRVRKLVLESAVTMPWDRVTRLLSPILFGPTERLTWAFMRLLLRTNRNLILKVMIGQLTTRNAGEAFRRMDRQDRLFVQRMIETSRSGNGFLNDLRHRVTDLSAIACPILAMYSPFDGGVSPENARHVAARARSCELYAVMADSHLLWIGPTAPQVWSKRLSFLKG